MNTTGDDDVDGWGLRKNIMRQTTVQTTKMGKSRGARLSRLCSLCRMQVVARKKNGKCQTKWQTEVNA